MFFQPAINATKQGWPW